MKKKLLVKFFVLMLLLCDKGWGADFGIASWYSESDPGINIQTANGEVFDDSELTCASWDFPFGTYLRVTRLTNDQSITCRVNDRGPSKRLKRMIDLSKRSFEEIAPLRLGLIMVKVEVVPEKLLNQHIKTDRAKQHFHQN